MSVGRRLLLSLVTLVLCTGILGGSALFGLLSLSRHYRAAEEQYTQLRSLYEIGHRAATVRLLLDDVAPNQRAIRQHLLIAAEEADKLGYESDSGAQGAGRSIEGLVAQAMTHDANEADAAILRADVNRLLGRVTSLAGAKQAEIVANRAAATARFQKTVGVVAVLFVGVVIVAAIVGVRQYRSIMRPLGALNRAVTQLGDMALGHEIAEQGDREFRGLCRHFNRTSSALANMHASMREQVETKSRQLVRSEQLAGVGYLAAGLAHEINNPLAIIAGYAEKSLRQLRSASALPDHGELTSGVERTLETICDEAFRCRDITSDLLLMAQPADGEAEIVPLQRLIERAIDLVREHPIARDRRIVMSRDASAEDPECRGHAPQLLQVFINLLANGLEACAAPHGQVVVRLERQRDHAIVTVTDNGIGMTDETLAHAFEPFFTDKPRRGLTGCGLGLSISHAIVERHGGQLYAHSDGPGRGSTFTIVMPVATAAQGDRTCLATTP